MTSPGTVDTESSTLGAAKPRGLKADECTTFRNGIWAVRLFRWLFTETRPSLSWELSSVKTACQPSTVEFFNCRASAELPLHAEATVTPPRLLKFE